MKVENRVSPPNYFSRREQYRLLVMCGMLMLVLVMMNEVRKPQMWRWMWAGSDLAEVEQGIGATETGTPETGTPEAAPVDNELIDTRAESTPMSPRSLPLDGFRATRQNASSNAIETALVEGAPDSYLPGIDADLLAPIEDNSVLRVAENEAWQTILGLLQETSQKEIETASLGYVGFSQLFRQTEVYRGRVVEVRGSVRRAEAISTRENPHNIQQLFRWIVEPDGPSNAPIVVYSLEKPADFQLGDNLREDAQFFGICFKRWAYAAGDGTRIAPLVLAKTANWEPRPVEQPVELPSWPVASLTLIVLGVVATAIAWYIYRITVFKHADVERARGYMSQGVDHLKDEEILPSVEQSLRKLADE